MSKPTPGGLEARDRQHAAELDRLKESRTALLAALEEFVEATDRVGLSMRGLQAKLAALDAIRKAKGE